MWPEIKRKLFHLISLVYVFGIVTLNRTTYISVIAFLLGAVTIFEGIRLRSPSVENWLYSRFGGLFRNEEQTKFTGIFWMLGGVLSTALLIPDTAVAVTVLLYVILGDASASLLGKSLGGPHWGTSPKRISGSGGCFLVCLMVGIIFLRPHYGWHGIWIGALTATLFELGLIPVNDNFLIPLASSLAMMLCYHIRPLFF